jgi:hypothetical protein
MNPAFSSSIATSVVAVLLAVVGVYVVALNARCVCVSLRNKRRGVDRHHSTVPLVAQIFLGFSWLLSPIVPQWALWTVALADVSLWTLPYGLFYAFRHRNDSETNG